MLSPTYLFLDTKDVLAEMYSALNIYRKYPQIISVASKEIMPPELRNKLAKWFRTFKKLDNDQLYELARLAICETKSKPVLMQSLEPKVKPTYYNTHDPVMTYEFKQYKPISDCDNDPRAEFY